jgi:hypothetical protein
MRTPEAFSSLGTVRILARRPTSGARPAEALIKRRRVPVRARWSAVATPSRSAPPYDAVLGRLPTSKPVPHLDHTPPPGAHPLRDLRIEAACASGQHDDVVVAFLETRGIDRRAHAHAHTLPGQFPLHPVQEPNVLRILPQAGCETESPAGSPTRLHKVAVMPRLGQESGNLHARGSGAYDQCLHRAPDSLGLVGRPCWDHGRIDAASYGVTLVEFVDARVTGYAGAIVRSGEDPCGKGGIRMECSGQEQEVGLPRFQYVRRRSPGVDAAGHAHR